MRQHFVVIRVRGEEAADGQVDPTGLVARELAVAQVRLVNDLGEMREAAVAQARALQEGFERAVVPVVAVVAAPAELEAGASLPVTVILWPT